MGTRRTNHQPANGRSAGICFPRPGAGKKRSRLLRALPRSTTIAYLEAVKGKLEISSDYKVRVPLGVTRQTVSSYRNGHSSFDHVVALRVAKILQLPPERVIADIELERAVNPELRDVWKRIAGVR